MKVICDRGALLDAVNLVSGVVAARTPRPQLTCVWLSATKGKDGMQLTLAATDAEVSIRLSIARVDVTTPGQALIPADKLRQIVQAQESEPTLTLEVEGEACHIRGTDAHFKVFGYPPSDFPPVADFPTSAWPGPHFSIQAGTIDSLVARTIFATAREHTRYAINGVLLKRDGKKLEMVATDGRRLALARASLTGESKDGAAISCIVPTKALSLLQKLFDDADERVTVALADNQILFSIGPEKGPARALLSSSLVEGAFPPYEDVIPKDHDIHVAFDRDVLTSAVRRAALLTNEDSRGVRLHFHGKEKRVELSSRAPEMGEAEVNVELASYKGGDIEIGFNPAFLVDALRVIEDPQVMMELKAGNKPGLIKSGTEFTYVVMPVSLA